MVCTGSLSVQAPKHPKLEQLLHQLLANIKSGNGSVEDCACNLLSRIERAGVLHCGKGSSPNSVGCYEVDAGLVTCRLNESNVSFHNCCLAMCDISSPSAFLPHLLFSDFPPFLAGSGATSFCLLHGGERLSSDEYHSTKQPRTKTLSLHDTVSVICMDTSTRSIAVASSTGCNCHKETGRISPCVIPNIGLAAHILCESEELTMKAAFTTGYGDDLLSGLYTAKDFLSMSVADDPSSAQVDYVSLEYMHGTFTIRVRAALGGEMLVYALIGDTVDISSTTIPERSFDERIVVPMSKCLSPQGGDRTCNEAP